MRSDSRQEFSDALCNVVAHQTHSFDSVDPPHGRLVSVPVFERGSRHRRDTGLATERDHEVDVANTLSIDSLGPLVADVDSGFGQCLGGQCIDAIAWFGSSRSADSSEL